MTKRIGIVYGGGHVSSFGSGTAGILHAARGKYDVLGFIDGYNGLENERHIKLEREMINPDVAGTALGSPRDKVNVAKAKETMIKLDICGLIVMGGNDHLSEAERLYREGDLPVVGWPKTMDNDLSGTWFTLGYPAAVNLGSQIVKNSHSGAITNKKIYVFVPFGRDTDWVAAALGLWGGADFVVPAERRYFWEQIVEKMGSVYEANGTKYGRPFAVVVVAEGAKIDGLQSHVREDEIDTHGNLKLDPNKLAVLLKDEAPKELRGRLITQPVTYVMRDWPTVHEMDHNCAWEAGRECVNMIQRGEFGSSAVLRENVMKLGCIEVSSAPLQEVSRQRFAEPEGWIDYDGMVIRPEFGKYYEPLFGKPPELDRIVYESFPLLRKLKK